MDRFGGIDACYSCSALELHLSWGMKPGTPVVTTWVSGQVLVVGWSRYFDQPDC